MPWREYSEEELDELDESQENAEANERPEQSLVSSLQDSEATDTRDWVNIGVQNVPVDQINTDDTHVHGPEDFQKVSYDQMVEGFNKLETVVTPAVNEGATREYFEDLDAKQGLTGAESYTNMYDVFYGNEHSAIQLEKDGDEYNVGRNGYHRIYVAQSLGLQSVPAFVLERR